MRIRELPPLRLYDEIITPSGNHHRWGPDEPAASNRPSRRRDSSTMPGGFESAEGTLARKPGVDYSDLERLSKWRRVGAGGEIAWEGRLERAPRVSGAEMAISPSAVGYQAHLADNKSVRMIYVDLAASTWGDMPINRIVALSGLTHGELSWTATDGGHVAAFPATPMTSQVVAELWYLTPSGLTIAKLQYQGDGSGSLPGWVERFGVVDTDTGSGGEVYSQTFNGALQTLTFTTPRRYVFEQLYANGSAITPAAGTNRRIVKRAVFGDHGLTTRAITGDTDGLYDADIVGHALGTWCPLLTYTNESLTAGTFVIPHATFPEPTTVAEIIKQVARYGLRDWAVWEGPTFWLHDRGVRGKNWRARVGPSGLEETGPQADRLWESVIVQYQDVDGTSRTVGPLGSGADTETADLKDDDPENPANKLGITRRDLLIMGVSTAEGAKEIGRRFLEEQKLLDTSGRATFVGHVMDDRGVIHPYWRVRAGDTFTPIDAADTSPRRIVRAEHDHDARSCSVDLDSPPEGLAALLEQLDVVLVPLGV